MGAIGLILVALLVVSAVVVLISMALGRAAASADRDSARDAEELLAMRALADDLQGRRPGSGDTPAAEMMLPTEVSEGLARQSPRFTRARPVPDLGQQRPHQR